MAGARFSLKAASGALVSEAESGPGGRVTFTDLFLVPGNYSLVETAPAAGYLPNTTTYQVVVQNDGRLFVDGAASQGFTVANMPELYGPLFTVTGQASPVAFNDHSFGPQFLAGLTIRAQLLNTDCQLLYGTTTQLIGNMDVGQFTFNNVMLGDYILYLHRPGYVARSMAFTVSENGPETIELEPPEGPVFTLTPGDVNMDAVVDSDDYDIINNALNGVLGLQYGQPGYNPSMDITGNGSISTADLAMVVQNMGARASDYPGFAGCVPRITI